jgi:hypothetical protein
MDRRIAKAKADAKVREIRMNAHHHEHCFCSACMDEWRANHGVVVNHTNVEVFKRS